MGMTAKARSERTRNAWKTRKAAKAKAGAAAAAGVAGAQGEASSGLQAMTESPVQAARRIGWHEGYQQGATEARQHAEDTRIAEFANLGRHYEANGVDDDKIIVVNLAVGTIKAIGARLARQPTSSHQMFLEMLSEAAANGGKWRWEKGPKEDKGGRLSDAAKAT